MELENFRRGTGPKDRQPRKRRSSRAPEAMRAGRNLFFSRVVGFSGVYAKIHGNDGSTYCLGIPSKVKEVHDGIEFSIPQPETLPPAQGLYDLLITLVLPSQRVGILQVRNCQQFEEVRNGVVRACSGSTNSNAREGWISIIHTEETVEVAGGLPTQGPPPLLSRHYDPEPINDLVLLACKGEMDLFEAELGVLSDEALNRLIDRLNQAVC